MRISFHAVQQRPQLLGDRLQYARPAIHNLTASDFSTEVLGPGGREKFLVLSIEAPLELLEGLLPGIHIAMRDRHAPLATIRDMERAGCRKVLGEEARVKSLRLRRTTP